MNSKILIKNKKSEVCDNFCDNFLRKLLIEWLKARNFTGEFKITYPKNPQGRLIELFYDEFNSKEMVEELAKELCELKK